MTLWTATRQTYAEAWRFLIALPIIAVAIVSIEGLQHVVEWRAGFYDSFAGMKAAGQDSGRMVLGALKVGWITLLSYWTTRYFVSRSAGRTAAFDALAVRKFAWVFLFDAVLGLLLLFGPDFFPAVGSARRIASLALLAFAVATYPVGVMLAPWMVGAALGDRRASPPFAFRRAGGSVLWGVALTLFAPLPVMAVHYGLGYGAVGRAPVLAISMLAMDAFLVGFLGVLANMTQVVVAERMAARAGETLELDRA